MNGTWMDFIGEQWTPEDFKEWYEEDQAEGRHPGWTLKDCVVRIVDSVFDDDDWWWTDAGYRKGLRDVYVPNRKNIIEGLMECLE